MMKFMPADCPDCGCEPYGIVERVMCVARLIVHGDTADYFGETDVDWNTQEQVIEADKVTLVCNGAHSHEWQASCEGVEAVSPFELK